MKRYLFVLCGAALSTGCSSSNKAEETRMVVVPTRVPVATATPITVLAKEAPAPALGKPTIEADDPPQRSRKRSSGEISQVEAKRIVEGLDIANSRIKSDIRNQQVTTTVMSTPQEYEYVQHLQRIMGILTRSKISNRNHWNAPGTFEKMKAEIDTAWSENLSFFNVPPRFRLTHRYLSAGLLKLKTAFDSMAISRAMRTSSTRASEDVQAAIALFKLAEAESRKADG